MAELLEPYEVHALLTEAGMPAQDGDALLSLAVRVGLLIDERNSLQDELEVRKSELMDLQEQLGWGERGIPHHD